MNSKILTESKALGLLLLALCFFISPMNLFASTQQSGTYRVTGTVKDATGETVIGASILEKGTNNGIITDMDGNFSLSSHPILHWSSPSSDTPHKSSKSNATTCN